MFHSQTINQPEDCGHDEVLTVFDFAGEHLICVRCREHLACKIDLGPLLIAAAIVELADMPSVPAPSAN